LINLISLADSFPLVPKTPEFNIDLPLTDILVINISKPPLPEVVDPVVGNVLVPEPNSVSPVTTTVPSSKGIRAFTLSFKIAT